MPNIRFGDLRALLTHLGFAERVRGDHHIFTRDGVVEILHLQPRGALAKPYQVKQVREVITGYGLAAGSPPGVGEKKSAKAKAGRRARVTMADNQKYEVILYWSKEDQAMIAEVPELPGCAADGATYQEALANVEVIMREWVETARELGRPIPVPRGRLRYA